ncbi:DUF4493 domain-containing protein [Parabacteroides distasonis]|nr:DUF4493 domain-containing protein [Parabacteroides distasonis]
MMRIKNWIYFVLAYCIALACTDEYSEPTGFLYLNVQEDATLLTKAGEAVVDESLQVAIIKADGDTLKVYQDYLREVKGERLILPVGTYTVAVSSNHDGKARWETPFYAGSTEVTVKQGEIATETVTCTIANTKVSVVYDKALADFFSDYQATVSNPSGKLIYTRDEYRSGFFSPEKLTVSLNLTNSEGYQFTLKNNYSDIKPKCHYIFRFSLNNSGEDEDDLGLDIDVSIDTTSYKEVFETINIKQEELSYIAPPRAKDWVGFDSLTHVYGYKKEKPLPKEDSLGFTIQKGRDTQLTRIQVTTDSPDFGLHSFDLLKENEASQAIALGFPKWPVAQEETLYALHTLDFSALIQNLSCGEKQPIEHKFTMEFLDDRNQVASLSFSIKIKPNLPASVESAPIMVWTNFAVIQGNCSETDSYFLVKAGNGAEKAVENIARDKDDNVTALLTGLTPGVTYTYRIVSDGEDPVSSDEASFCISKPLEVPNLRFEEWNTITKNKLSFNMGGDYQSPNATDDFNEVYWESGNYGASAIDKILTESTTEVAVEGSIYAAKMQSLYAGYGSLGAFSAGSVFTGKPTSVGTKGATLEYGRLHNGFPTRLSGYCKYSPGAIDYVKNSKKSGGQDQAIIYIALSTDIFRLQSLTDGTINRFDQSASSIIAYGEYKISKKISAYEPFEIPLIYREGKLPAAGTPVYITIVATCSIDGDEFTGSTNSVLYIDELSLDYDYNAASLAKTSFGSLQPNNLSGQTSNE